MNFTTEDFNNQIKTEADVDDINNEMQNILPFIVESEQVILALYSVCFVASQTGALDTTIPFAMGVVWAMRIMKEKGEISDLERLFKKG